MPSFSIETNPLCNIVCGGVPMSVMGGVFDTQLMHAAWLCLCSQTKLVCVPFGKWTTLCDFLGRNAHLEVHTTWVTQKVTVVFNKF